MSDLIEVHTPTLSGAALDWAVANVEGRKVEILRGGSYGRPDTLWFVATEGGQAYAPSKDWVVGGPLIEMRIEYLESFADRTEWDACCWGSEVPHPSLYAEQGETPLVAACRAIVAAKLGDTVQVPKELI